MKYLYLTLITFALGINSFGQNIPIDFEAGGFGATWNWTVFQNGVNPPLEIVANPDPSGINYSPNVAKFNALQVGAPFAGCETQHGSDIGTYNITASNNIIRIMVYKTKISNVGIKLVTSTNASLGELLVANTTVNQWEQLTFDFSAHIGGMTYDQIVIFPDFVNRNADDVIYFDNVWGPSACASTTSNANVTTCSSYLSPGGNIYTTSGTYEDIIQNAAGCDSIITTNLTINSIVTSVSVDGTTLTSNAVGASYVWLDCGNNFSLVSGEFGQSFTPQAGGYYAVQVTTNGCQDTSSCISVSGLGINDLKQNKLSIYPNPSTGIFTIDADISLETIRISDVMGREVLMLNPTESLAIINLSELNDGIYIVTAESEGKIYTQRILKK